MKTKLTIAILLLCCCRTARADLDIREITPAKAKQQGWLVEVHENEDKDYVRFTVELPAILRSQGRSANLSAWHQRKLIVSCILGVHKRKQGNRYEFALSKQYAADAVFELGDDPAVLIGGETYRMHLSKFIRSKQKSK